MLLRGTLRSAVKDQLVLSAAFERAAAVRERSAAKFAKYSLLKGRDFYDRSEVSIISRETGETRDNELLFLYGQRRVTSCLPRKILSRST